MIAASSFEFHLLSGSVVKMRFVQILLLFSSTLIISKGADIGLEQNGTKRSAVCLIHNLANFNHINAVFEQTNKTNINGMDHFTYKLTLGNEMYSARATSIQITKDKVSKEAYSLTKYPKPTLKKRECVIDTTIRTDSSILYEYAVYINQTVVIDVKHISQRPSTYEITLTLNGKQASATGHGKQKVKQEAAKSLIEQFGREIVITALERKYDLPCYHRMNPIQRLDKIVKVSGSNDMVEYSVISETDQTDASGKKTREVIVEAAFKSIENRGSGATLNEAKRDAAKGVLKLMNFAVV